MRILLAHNHYQQAGGEDLSFAAESAMLSRQGHEVVEYRVHNDAIRQMSGLSVAARTVWNPHSYRTLRALIRQHRPDVCHFNNTFPLISPAAYYAAHREGVAVVQSLRNFRLLCLSACLFRDGHVCEDCLQRLLPTPGLRHRCYRQSLAASTVSAAMLITHRLLRTYRREVDVYIALTQFARAKLIAAGLPAERIVVKPNFLHPVPSLGTGDERCAVFVGRLSPEKGLRTALAAWELLKNPPLLKIIGTGPDETLVRDAAARNPAVQWLGSLPAAQVLDHVGRAAALLFCSECYEAFGRVGAEALAKGTPVIAAGLGAVTEMIEAGKTGLFYRPNDPADLARQVSAFFNLPSATRAQMRQNARARFEGAYTAEINYPLLMQAYQQAIEFRRGQRPRTAG